MNWNSPVRYVDRSFLSFYPLVKTTTTQLVGYYYFSAGKVRGVLFLRQKPVQMWSLALPM